MSILITAWEGGRADYLPHTNLISLLSRILELPRQHEAVWFRIHLAVQYYHQLPTVSIKIGMKGSILYIRTKTQNRFLNCLYLFRKQENSRKFVFNMPVHFQFDNSD